MPYLAAKVIAFVFHPLLIPSYALLLVFWFNPYLFISISAKDKLKFLGMIAFYTAIVPAVAVWLLSKMEFIYNIYLHDKKERIVPIIITGIMFLVLYFRLKTLYFPVLISQMMLSGAIMASVTIALSWKWKISLHCMGIAALATWLYILYPISPYNIALPFVMIILLAGAIGTSRLMLNAHHPLEVYLGYAVGWGSMMAAMAWP